MMAVAVDVEIQDTNSRNFREDIAFENIFQSIDDHQKKLSDKYYTYYLINVNIRWFNIPFSMLYH